MFGRGRPVSDPESSEQPQPSKPECGVNGGYTMPYADSNNVYHFLNAKGGVQCCTDDQGGCTVVGLSNDYAVDICSDPGVQLCDDCARVADYVAGLQEDCQEGRGDDIKVGGSQDIVETPGLKV